MAFNGETLDDIRNYCVYYEKLGFERYTYCLDATLEELLESKIEQGNIEALDEITGEFQDFIDSMGTGLAGVLDELMDNAEMFSKPVIESYNASIDSVYNTISDASNSAINAVFGMIEAESDRLSSYLEAADSKIGSLIEGSMYDLDMLSELIGSGINSNISGQATLITNLIDDSESIALTSIDKVSQLADAQIENVNNIYTESLSPALETIDTVLDTVKEQSKSLYELIKDLLSGLTDTLFPSFSSLASAADTGISGITESFTRKILAEINQGFERTFDNLADWGSWEGDVSQLSDRVEKQDTVVGLLLSVVMYVISNAQLAYGMASTANVARLETMLQKVWSYNPSKTYTPSECISLAVRGFISDSRALEESLTHGYNNERTEKLIEAGKTPIDIERARDAYLRGNISQNDYKNMLQRHGFSTDDIETLVGIIDVRPNPNDLISMAVRDVFSTDSVNRFGLFEDLPDDFIKEAKKSGLSEKWARYYWGAHWRLPSAQQGFEMYHRGVINNDDLDLLLRSLDVSPFWRSKLKAIAYNPITRVDVRRMYRIGVIDRSEVKKRYKDIGYNEADSELLTQFTELYDGQDEEDEDIDYRSLTEANIKRLYRMGTIEKDYAIASMQELGYTKDTSSVIVESWDTEETITDRENLITLIVRKALDESWDDREIESAVRDYDLTDTERDRIEKTIYFNTVTKTAKPTKAELNKMVKEGIINKTEWEESLSKMGYSDYWIEKYYSLYLE